MKQRFFTQFKEQLGRQGMAGIVLLALAGAFQAFILAPLEQEVSVMHRHLDEAHAKSSLQSRTYSLGTFQNELTLFFDSLPAEEDVTDILGSIYSIAEGIGVTLNQAEYHPENGKNKPRIEYRMVFPVQGDYAKIRYFVARVLADHSAIALDQVNFQRDRISDPILKADIRMTLFLRPSGYAR